ncbi:MAG: hypothetical protein PHY47_00590 [Lachnospiraceae bacterium]|nr:hypothetical protein [Lachnospiraceae bacterium]
MLKQVKSIILDIRVKIIQWRIKRIAPNAWKTEENFNQLMEEFQKIKLEKQQENLEEITKYFAVFKDESPKEVLFDRGLESLYDNKEDAIAKAEKIKEFAKGNGEELDPYDIYTVTITIGN